MGGEQDVIGRFIMKILYVGAFAFILSNFSNLADIIFRSFAAAGITAGGGAMTADDLLKPGRLAGIGFEAAWPLLQQVSELMGFTTFFDNFLVIAVLLFAWAVVILAFFILAVQLFVTIIEFKLTTLAGFILVPFALWNRTSFLAERVLGSVVSSGIKRSDEHTSELQSLMRISYAVFCLKKKKHTTSTKSTHSNKITSSNTLT